MEVRLNSKQLKDIIKESVKKYLTEINNNFESDYFYSDNLKRLEHIIYEISDGLEFNPNNIEEYIEYIYDVYNKVNGYEKSYSMEYDDEEDDINIELPTHNELNIMINEFKNWLESYYDDKVNELWRDYRHFNEQLNKLL